MIALPLGRITALRGALGDDFEVDIDMLRDAVLHARSANAFYLPNVTKIDFFGRGYEPLHRNPVAVIVTVRHPETEVTAKSRFFGASHLQATKNRRSTQAVSGVVSEKQWRDIVSVLRTSGSA